MSRRSACQARSGSTRDRLRGEPRSTSRGVAAREAERREQARARPPRRAAGRSRPPPRARGAKVCPRLSSARTPRSCGSCEADGRLVGGRGADVELAAGEQLASSRARPSPCRRSRSGSVSSSSSSITTRARPVEGADEVLALREVDRRSCRRSPRRPGRRGSSARRPTGRRAGRSRRRSPRRRSCSRRRARRSCRRGRGAARSRAALDDRDRLRLLAGRQLVLAREPVAERLLGARAVDAHHRRVGDERDGPVAGDELAEPVERAELVVHAAGGEHDAVRVASRRRRRPRGRAAGAPRRAAGTLPRPARAAGREPLHALPGGVDVDVDRGRRTRARASAPASPAIVTAPPPSAITGGSGCGERDARDVLLERAERRLARARRRARGSTCRRAPRSRRSRSTNGRPSRAATSRPSVVFPAPMKPDEREVPVRARSQARTTLLLGGLARPGDALEVDAPGGDEVADRVAAELLVRRAGELPRDRRLGDDGERLDRGDVGALDERLRRLAGLEIDRARAASSASAAASSRRARRSPRRSRCRPRSRRRGSCRGDGRCGSRRGPRSRTCRRARSRRRSRRP